MKVENQIGDDPGRDADEQEHTERNQSGHGLGGRPAVSVLAAILLIIQIMAFTIAASSGADSGDQLWPPSKKSSVTEWILIAITVVYVTATVVYVVITSRQLGEMRRSNARMLREVRNSNRQARHSATAQLKETRRANALALRAWLVVETVDIGRLSPHAMVTVKVRNYGKIPAIKVLALDNFIPAAEYPFPDPLDSDDEPKFPVTIGAGLEHTFHFFMPGTDQEAIDRIERNDAILVLTVRFRYTDALATRGNTGYTGFYSSGSYEVEGPHFARWSSGCFIF